MDDVRVGDIGVTVTGKTPSTKHSEYFDGDIMFVTPVDLKQNYYLKKSERYITEAGLDSIKKNSISGKSVLVGCIGSDLGNIAMTNERCATNQQINSITNFKNEYSPEYVYYWFTTKKEWLHSIAGNTTTPIINKTDFDNIIIQIPSKKEQDKVVDILSTIDERIATNSKIIDISEKLIREIYDYWFVQFDFPDENGRPYKSSGGEMVYNETLKREIPKGWSNKTLQELIQNRTESTVGTHNDKCIDLSIMPSGSLKLDKYNYGDSFSSNMKSMHKGDILFGSIRPYLKKAGIAPYNGVRAGTVHCFYPKDDKNRSLCSVLLTGEDMFQYAIQKSGGNTRMPSVSAKDLMEYVLAYNESVSSEYNEICIPVIDKIIMSINENITLASIRDWLLPMLMNGQIRVSD